MLILEKHPYDYLTINQLETLMTSAKPLPRCHIMKRMIFHHTQRSRTEAKEGNYTGVNPKGHNLGVKLRILPSKIAQRV